jgi:hypothetical protein
MILPWPIPYTETESYLRHAALLRHFERWSHLRRWRPDWLAGAAGFERAHFDLQVAV